MIRGTLAECVGATLGDQTRAAQWASRSGAPRADRRRPPPHCRRKARHTPGRAAVAAWAGRPPARAGPSLAVSRPHLPSWSEQPHQRAHWGPEPPGAPCRCRRAAVLVCRDPSPLATGRNAAWAPGAPRVPAAQRQAQLGASPWAPPGSLAGGLPLPFVSPSHRSLHVVPVLALRLLPPVLGPSSTWEQPGGRSGCAGPRLPRCVHRRLPGPGPGQPRELTLPPSPLAR